MRHSLVLPIHSAVASETGSSVTPLTAAASTLRIRSREGRVADITIRLFDEALEVSVIATDCSELPPRVRHPEWWLADHVVFFLNPNHDHATRWMFAIADGHPLQSAAEWVAPGEEHGENVLRTLPQPWSDGDVETNFKTLDARRFFASLRVTSPLLKRAGGTPVGLEVKVGFAGDRVVAPLVWPEPASFAADTPLQFGDVYSHAPAFVPERMELQAPVWGVNTELLLSGTLARAAQSRGFAKIEAILPGDSEKYMVELPWTAETGKLDLRLPAYFSPRAKWSNNLMNTARLRVEVSDADRTTLWSGEFPFGFDCGIIVREKYGPRGGKLAPRPSPDSSAFVEEFRQYILTRIPDYRARGTITGARSDFFLEDPDGVASLDLADPRWPDALAALLAQRFPDWQDALCAVAAWIYHPLITRHSSSWHAIANVVSVDSIPRLGGCFCGDTARLGAFLAEKIGVALNVPLKGQSLGLRGHLATLVDTPHGEVVIDGMLGYWFHTLDNARLATLAEMRADAAVTSRVWCFARAHDHEFFHGVDNQIIQPWRNTPLVWPR